MDSVRSVRIFGSAVFDWVMTFVAAFLLQRYQPGFIYGTLGFVSPLQLFASMVPLGVLVHWMTGQETHMTKQLDAPGLNVFKILSIVSIIIVFYEAIK